MHARARVSLSRLGYRRSACGAGQVQSAEAAEQGQVQSVALGRRFFGRQDRVGVRRRCRRVAGAAAVAHSRSKRESCRRGSAPPVRLHGIARKVTNRPRSLPPSLRSPTPATVTHAGAPARARAHAHNCTRATRAAHAGRDARARTHTTCARTHAHVVPFRACSGWAPKLSSPAQSHAPIEQSRARRPPASNGA